MEIDYGDDARDHDRDVEGRPLPGVTLADGEEVFEDSIEHPIVWKDARALGRLAGTPVRLRFVLKDADLYAFRFRRWPREKQGHGGGRSMQLLLRGLLMMSAFLASGSGARAEDSLLLADFPASLQDLAWDVVNDGVMGGRSQGGFRPEGGSLLFTGTTNTDGGGFSSIRSRVRRFDLGDYDGIRLRVHGDGRTYTFRLTTWDTRDERYRPSYWADFPTSGGGWEVIDVPFSRFRPRWRGRWLEGPQLNPRAVDGLGVMIYDGADGPFRLEVDWIRAYREMRPFSMSDFQWQKRPLLLFAEEEQDPLLQRQLADVEATRDRFDERDMVLIVVLGAGASRAESRTLTAGDADRLRSSYGVERGAFALRLVGKDGSVKRESSAAVPVQALYEQIDSMPMRQQEMRER